MSQGQSQRFLTMGVSSFTSRICQGSRPAGAVLMTWFRAPPAHKDTRQHGQSFWGGRRLIGKALHQL